MRELLEASAAAAGIDDFGLRMAERRALSNLGPLALLLRDQPTVRQALEAWKLNSKVHTDSVSMRIEENDGIAIISMVLFVDTPVPKRQVVEMTVGVLYRTMRLFIGDRMAAAGLLCAQRAAQSRNPSASVRFKGRVQLRFQRHSLPLERS